MNKFIEGSQFLKLNFFILVIAIENFFLLI